MSEFCSEPFPMVTHKKFSDGTSAVVKTEVTCKRRAGHATSRHSHDDRWHRTDIEVEVNDDDGASVSIMSVEWEVEVVHRG